MDISPNAPKISNGAGALACGITYPTGLLDYWTDTTKMMQKI
ncbi:hypothetical protein VB735_10350 [Halotia wernerae UHCC 0503]|nr:hypothetical protein [Halotia wernerae UHCC 0503]